MGDSIWKKEISFGKKAKAEPTPPTPKDPERNAAVERVLSPPEKQSIWKKELSFGKKKAAPAATPAAAPAPAPAAPAEKQSIWKKEISFGRKPKAEPAPAAPAVAPEPTAAPPVELPSAVERVLAPVAPVEASPAPVAAVPAPVAPVEAVPAPVVEPVPAPVVEAVPAPVVEVAPAPIAQLPTQPVAPAPAPFAEVPAAPVVEVPAVPVAPVPAPAPVAPAPAPTPAPAYVPPAAAAPVPAPAAPAPEVPAEAPPAPAAKVPFWKKELSFGRKAEKPAAKTAEAAEKKPFWKKELSFGRGAAAPKEAPEPKAAKAPKQRKEPKEPKVPFWKRELGGGRKQKQPAAAETPTATEPKVPFWKRELGGGKSKEPKEKRAKAPRVRGGGGSRNAKRVVGLKVGASQVAAARVANNGVAELLQLAREPLEPGVVVAGELRDPEALAEALKTLFRRHKLPKKDVRLGIANNRIGVRTFEIGGIDDPKQLANAIRFRAQEALPIPIDEAVLDYQLLGETTNDAGETVHKVLLVVAYRELIDRYVDACRKAGITLSGIDLEAFALLRSLSAPRPKDEAPSAAVVAVAIGHERSTFAVSDGRVCEFTRVLDWGGSALDVAIARVLDQAPSEADLVKRAVSLLDDSVPEGMAPEHAAAARDAMRKQIQSFARELVSSLQFYQSQPGSLGIGEIVVTGGTGHLPGLVDELQRLIGVRVRVGDPLARMKVAKRVAEHDQLGSLAVAIGLGIED